jgi:hypothetical protein
MKYLADTMLLVDAGVTRDLIRGSLRKLEERTGDRSLMWRESGCDE